MNQHVVVCSLLASSFAILPLQAQEISTPLISEELQHIAKEVNVAEQLGISWRASSPVDVGNYIGILTAAEVAAVALAKEGGRSKPDAADYITALSLYCVFPPNKPPVAKEYRHILYSTYYDEELRKKIPSAIGPQAYEIANNLYEINPASNVAKYTLSLEALGIEYPDDLETYKNVIFDFDKLQ